MPRYDYTCPDCGHKLTIQHGMNEEADDVTCPNCSAGMHRKYSMPMVTWGGAKPSQGTLHPSIRRLIDDAPRRRDAEHKP